MSSGMGNNIKIQLFGQSHSKGLGVVIDGLPAGEKIDMERVIAFLQRRAGGKNSYSTSRAEPDIPSIISGLVDDVTCGAPLCAVFENTNTRSGDYEQMRRVPRPSHADYTAHVKHSGYNDVNGGGHFSGRLTLPLCFAGAVCLQILERRGITVDAHVFSIGDVPFTDSSYNNMTYNTTENLAGSSNRSTLTGYGFPTINKTAGEKMTAAIMEAADNGDSIGGIIEGGIWGLPVGLGEPIFDNLESRLAYGLFAIPAVKGVEFGVGFAAAHMRGSEFNDPFYSEDGKVRTKTNHSGGILGGISNGMPVIFKTAFKPTPSISLPQQSVNLITGEDTMLKIHGRHDPCIVPRAVPCVIAAAAVTMLDILFG